MTRGDGRVYLRGNRWWFAFSYRGEKQRAAAAVWDKSLKRERPARSEAEAWKSLEAKRREVEDRGSGLRAERVTVDQVLDAWILHQETREVRSLRTTRVHLKPVREQFGSRRVIALTTAALVSYQRSRQDAGRANATVNRELEALRSALRWASRLTPPMLGSFPTVPMLPVDNARQGFFTAAEVTDLLQHVTDADVADFISWAFRTGMRRGEISRLTWEMLDRGGSTWVLRIPGSITKNARGRSFSFDGEAREIIERRLEARRLDCPLIFHRAGRPMGPFRDLWRAAVKKAAGLPAGRRFHDLRRSAVRDLIRSGVDPAIAMKVSGHRTRFMLDRYNIIEESETAAALRTRDAWLLTQPKTTNVVKIAVGQASGPAEGAHLGHSRPVTPREDWCRRWDLNPH